MKAPIACVALMALVIGCAKSADQRADSAGGAVGATTAAATPAPAPTPTPPPAMTAENVIAKMGGGDSAEVALSKLVETKATNAGVKSFARLLVTEHGAHARQVAALAKSANLTPVPPANDTQEHQQTLDRFTSLPKGAAFDTAFVNFAVEEHQKEISDLRAAEQSIQQPEVKAFIAKTIPVMQKHLDRAQALQKQLSGAP